MRRHGINAVRTYTVPSRRVLDLAEEHGLSLFVGLPWAQHVAFLDDKDRVPAIEQSVREGIRASAGHPAVWAYAIGNEIPASIVRWHGRRRLEQFLERLYVAAKEEDGDRLVTYVNYPSTEYLHLPFLDFVAFNVFLEQEEALEAYIARLQNIAGNRPLVLTELGLDSRRHGPEVQAAMLDWQVRTAFRTGAAGAFVFAWTDEWHRGGRSVDDWDFGLTTRLRRPKPALAAVDCAFREAPFGDAEWPRVSVVVCSHNGGSTIRECLEGVAAQDYPDFETLVVDDGSTDDTSEIAADFDVRLIRTENRGLSSARNTGVSCATGEIIAFLDDDAVPDRDWLRYLAVAFASTPHVGIGGPNVPPPSSSARGAAIAKAPGGPVHVLLSDREAEHIPGCNMAFRREALVAVGGFDTQFREAGDDVDICWRLRDRGWTLGFCPAAMVWHRPRATIRAYLRQQRGYGRAEGLLERKWPERYNRTGHLRWAGEVYPGRAAGAKRWHVYYGTWGSGLFQSVYQRAPGALASLPLMPEWYLLLLLLGFVSVYELVVGRALVAMPGTGIPVALVLLAVSTALLVVQTARTALASLPTWPRGVRNRVRLGLTLTALHLAQPAARLAGRLGAGLTPWRRRGRSAFAFPRPRRVWIWSESWRSPSEWLSRLEESVRLSDAASFRGGAYDRWDLQCRIGPLASARVRMAVEEHGDGKQLVRFRIWPVWSRFVVIAGLVLAAWLGAELVATQSASALVVAALAGLIALRALHEAGAAVGLLLGNVARLAEWPNTVVTPAESSVHEPAPTQNGGRPSRLRERARSNA